MNAAAPGLVARPLLVGGEPVRLVGVHPGGPIELELPRIALQAKRRAIESIECELKVRPPSDEIDEDLPELIRSVFVIRE